MDYYCEVCNMFIKPKSKSRHSKSNNHQSLDMRKHIKLTINNPNIDDIDKIFYIHIKNMIINTIIIMLDVNLNYVLLL